MTLTLEQAQALADAELDRVRRADLQLVFIGAMTEEVPEGWVFFWDDQRHLDGDEDYALGGGGPIFVARDGSLVHMVWSGESWETALARYRSTSTFDGV